MKHFAILALAAAMFSFSAISSADLYWRAGDCHAPGTAQAERHCDKDQSFREWQCVGGSPDKCLKRIHGHGGSCWKGDHCGSIWHKGDTCGGRHRSCRR